MHCSDHHHYYPYQSAPPQNLSWTENSLGVLARVDRRRAVREGGWGRALEVAREGRAGIIIIIIIIIVIITIIDIIIISSSIIIIIISINIIIIIIISFYYG